MTRKFIAFAALLAAVLGFAAAGLPSLRPALAAEEKPTARAQIGQPVEAAQTLLKQKKFKEALAKLHEADAVPDKTPYETYVIEATRAAIYQSSGDYVDVIKPLEAVLATGILPPAEALQRVEALVQLDYQLKDYPKVVDYANRYYRDGGSAAEPRLLMAQAYYLQNDFANAAKTIRAVMQAEEKTGTPPAENQLLILLSSEVKLQDATGRIATLEQLAALYPKNEYWVDLLAAVQKKPGFSSRLTLDVDRLSIAAGAMNAPAQYMEAAQLALQEGLPGDAKAFLDKGYAAGVLGRGAEADRQKRLADMAARQSGEDLKGLAQLGPEADAAPSGLAWTKLGEAYSSYGQYDKAIAAFANGIRKGGLEFPEDAKLHLGIAYLLAGQKEKAKATLDAVGGNDGVRDLARLWLIEAGIK